ncbi:zinc-binding alcohol dehydrogenase family protein [Lacticaseibacillus pabuli]|uniref:Zinc-type alcohol dehydrogenase-like protein n=1 Tax=Lacticaseibacillus pabuli TaxID=3025672 RepID=A0ABY7WTA0_9LACO|nr:zinc-binding alcohol dehydrogenase family protein [Lacticaseibacillus sp. KACC 23028]WDF83029.1 zinc-binding alcohol dehydrogenase family protein [Lacticaseibacillus sp. KACC 23028]
MSKNYGVAYYQALPATDPQSFVDTTLPMPTIGPNDLLVEVSAVAVNPVDTKLRLSSTATEQPQVSGHDALGTVAEMGIAVQGFHLGDRVAYAGTSTRAGSEQHYQAVDYRLVGHVPSSLTDEQAVAFPLVSVTAWELLFDKMGFVPAADANGGKTLLVINGAGGVGSVLTQLASWAGLNVVATASPKHAVWLKELGVKQIVDHHQDLLPQLKKLGNKEFDGVAILYAPEPYMRLAADLVAPFGHVGCLVLPTAPLDVAALKNKSASLDFEYMFARSDAGLDMARQGEIITHVMELILAGIIQDITGSVLGPINAANVREATVAVDGGHGTGKVVITGGFTD